MTPAQTKHPKWMIGIDGLILNVNDIKRIQHPDVDSIILFQRNFNSPTQLFTLCTEIHAIKPTLKIYADQEGGRVQRFQHPTLQKLPAPYHILDAEIPKYAKQMVQQLQSLGIDRCLAPVVDLYHEHSPIIKERAFSNHPTQLLQRVIRYIEVMNDYSMPGVLKHFPGHGFTSTDTHLQLSADDRAWQEIQETDLHIYQTLIDRFPKANQLQILVSHIQYPKINPDIASLSSFWINDVLKSQLNFQGEIIADDLGMKAAHLTSNNPYKVAEIFFNAGGDIACIGNDYSML